MLLYFASAAVLDASRHRSGQVHKGDWIGGSMVQPADCPCTQPGQQCLKPAVREAVRYKSSQMSGEGSQGGEDERWGCTANSLLLLYFALAAIPKASCEGSNQVSRDLLTRVCKTPSSLPPPPASHRSVHVMQVVPILGPLDQRLKVGAVIISKVALLLTIRVIPDNRKGGAS